jgi:hypothetical protein
MKPGDLVPAGSVAAELAAALPQFDPEQRPGRNRSARGVLVLSILIHLLAAFLFRDVLLGVIVEREETVVVKMLEPLPEPTPEPEPERETPKARPKTVAQRVLRAQVSQFKRTMQHEVRVVQPVPVVTSAQRIEVTPVQRTEAPKEIEHREIVTRKVDVFGEVKPIAVPVPVDKVSPTVHQVQSARPSAGPHRMEAAGPTNVSQAVDVESPAPVRGVISDRASEGGATGARIAALETGTSDRFARGGEAGSPGGRGGATRDCDTDPVCQAYLAMIRERVLARWRQYKDAGVGKHVKLLFRIDRGGSAHGIQIASADSRELGDSCLMAFRHSSPFPPPSQEILYIVDKTMGATFSLHDEP